MSAPKDVTLAQQSAAVKLLLGPLADTIQQWQACGASNWVIRTLTKGYRLQFVSTPPCFTRSSVTDSGKICTFCKRRSPLLNKKGAIQRILSEQSQSGFYLRYFLVLKKGGGLQLISDLRALNKFLRCYRFRMLTHLTPGDWFVSIYLRDAYFQIPIYPPHMKYLRFAFRPFGLLLSPRMQVHRGCYCATDGERCVHSNLYR